MELLPEKRTRRRTKVGRITVNDLLIGLHQKRHYSPTPVPPDVRYCPPNKRYLTDVAGHNFIVHKYPNGMLESRFWLGSLAKFPIAEHKDFCLNCCMICNERNLTDLQGDRHKRPNHRSRKCNHQPELIEMWMSCDKFDKNDINYYILEGFDAI